MALSKEIYQTARRLLQEHYKGDVDLGTTEYSIRDVSGEKFLLIPGTNETADWKKNFNLSSQEGIKTVGVEAMQEILHDMALNIERPKNLNIITHSKSAVTGVSFADHAKKMGYSWQIIAFNPARSVRRFTNIKLDNLVMFRNRFDPVSELLGKITLTHPKCKTYFNFSFRHGLEYWEKFIEDMG